MDRTAYNNSSNRKTRLFVFFWRKHLNYILYIFMYQNIIIKLVQYSAGKRGFHRFYVSYNPSSAIQEIIKCRIFTHTVVPHRNESIHTLCLNLQQLFGHIKLANKRSHKSTQLDQECFVFAPVLFTKNKNKKKANKK